MEPRQRPQDGEPQSRETIVVPFSHAQITADTGAAGSTWLWQCPAGQKWRHKRTQYVNPTGLLEDATNYFAIKIMQAAVVVAVHSTLTGAQGTLTAGVAVELVPSAIDADLIIEGGEALHLLLDETGTATLPAGNGLLTLERVA